MTTIRTILATSVTILFVGVVVVLSVTLDLFSDVSLRDLAAIAGTAGFWLVQNLPRPRPPSP